MTKSNSNRTENPGAKSPEKSQPCDPPALKEHLREMDPYRAFVVGERDRDPANGEGVAQYLDAWDRKWAEIIGDENKKKPKL